MVHRKTNWHAFILYDFLCVLYSEMGEIVSTAERIFQSLKPVPYDY